MRSPALYARRVTSLSHPLILMQLPLLITSLMCMCVTSVSTARAESRVQLKVKLNALQVAAAKESGKPWDTRIPLRKGSALPDLVIEVKRGVEVLLTTTVRRDTLTASYTNDRFFFWSGDVITVNVWDKDIARNDLIGSFLIKEERGTVELKGGQVESLKMVISEQPSEIVINQEASTAQSKGARGDESSRRETQERSADKREARVDTQKGTQRDAESSAHTTTESERESKRESKGESKGESKREPKRDRIATLDIKQIIVEDTKADGKPWDVKIPFKPQSALPDLWVEVRHEGRILLQTPVAKDTAEVKFTDQFVSFPPNARLEVKVWDKDLTKNDLIGTIIIAKQSGLVTFSHDRVKALKVMIVGGSAR